MNNRKNQGVITIYMALMLPVILAFLVAAFDITRINGAKNHVTRAAYNAIDGALANYDKYLFREYGVFSFEATDELTEDMKELYMKNVSSAYGEGEDTKVFDLYKLSQAKDSIDIGYTYETFKDNKTMKSQMVQSMQLLAPENLVRGVIDIFKGFADMDEKTKDSETINDISEEVKELDDLIDDLYQGQEALFRLASGLEGNTYGLLNTDRTDTWNIVWRDQDRGILADGIGRTEFSQKSIKYIYGGNDKYTNIFLQNALATAYTIAVVEFNNREAEEVEAFNEKVEEMWEEFDKKHEAWSKADPNTRGPEPTSDHIPDSIPAKYEKTISTTGLYQYLDTLLTSFSIGAINSTPLDGGETASTDLENAIKAVGDMLKDDKVANIATKIDDFEKSIDSSDKTEEEKKALKEQVASYKEITNEKNLKDYRDDFEKGLKYIQKMDNGSNSDNISLLRGKLIDEANKLSDTLRLGDTESSQKNGRERILDEFKTDLERPDGKIIDKVIKQQKLSRDNFKLYVRDHVKTYVLKDAMSGNEYIFELDVPESKFEGDKNLWKKLKDKIEDLMDMPTYGKILDDKFKKDEPNSIEDVKDKLPAAMNKKDEEPSKDDGSALDTEGREKSFFDKVYLMEYVMTHFKNGVEIDGQIPSELEHSEDFETSLDYEVEAILIGDYNDNENISGVANRLFLTRMVLNGISIGLDGDARRTLNTISNAFCFGNPIIKACIYAVVFLGWTTLESNADVCDLLNGFKVPLLKDSNSFVIPFATLIPVPDSGKVELPKKEDLDNCKISTEDPNNNQDNKDKKAVMMDYHAYLRVFLAVMDEDDLINRSKNLMVANYLLVDSEFDYNVMKGGATMKLSSSASMIFDNKMFMKEGEGKDITISNIDISKSYE